VNRLSISDRAFVRYVSLTLAIICCLGVHYIKQPDAKWRSNQAIMWDVQEYYAYLPATLIHKDLGFSYIDAQPQAIKDKVWLHQPADKAGSRVGKMSLGMAVAYTPFFLTAYAIDLSRGNVPNGYSTIYHLAIALSGLVYLIIGLACLALFCYRLNLSIPSICFALICLTFGTNLFYYSLFDGGFSHTILFALLAGILMLTQLWYSHPKLLYTIVLAFSLGLAILIRPISVYMVVIPVFWTIGSGYRVVWHYIKTYWNHILLAGLLVLLLIVPQLLYWHAVTGQWFYYSYTNQGFFFDNPKIIQGLFGYRKGWFIYTPIALLIFPSLLLLYKELKPQFWSILLYLFIHLYVIFSWWCWWYGGSFGTRTMVDTYAILGIGIALIYIKLMTRTGQPMPAWRSIIKPLFIVYCGGCIWLNMFQTKQYNKQIIHFDSMNKDLYWATFLKKDSLQKNKFDSLVSPPDYEAAIKGVR